HHSLRDRMAHSQFFTVGQWKRVMSFCSICHKNIENQPIFCSTCGMPVDLANDRPKSLLIAQREVFFSQLMALGVNIGVLAITMSFSLPPLLHLLLLCVMLGSTLIMVRNPLAAKKVEMFAQSVATQRRLRAFKHKVLGMLRS